MKQKKSLDEPRRIEKDGAKATPLRITLVSPCMGSYGGFEGFVLAVEAGVTNISEFAL